MTQTRMIYWWREVIDVTQARESFGTCLALAALVVLTCAGAQAQREPLILLNLPTAGAPSGLGRWLQDALRDEPVRTRWATLDALTLDGGTAAVVTWSDPERRGAASKRLRSYLRSGGGLVYVIGDSRQDINRARALFGPLDMTITELDGGASSARWADHPLTDGLSDIGAVMPGSAISGPGASPLIRSGGREIAIALDWGPLGRAIVLDQSVLFDQLYESTPRPSVRQFLLNAVLWAVGSATNGEGPKPPKPPKFDEPRAQGPVGALPYDAAVVDLPDDEKDDWPAIRRVLLAELDRAGLSVAEPPQREGEPLLDAGVLDRAGLLVIGSGRDDEEIHWAEPLAVGWFFSRGGRILAIPHAAGGTMKRMVGFNELLTQLRIAVSLERNNGRAELAPHPITRHIGMPEDGLKVREGAQVWAPLTEPLVTVRGRPAAVAWQLGEGRIVVIDGELLRSQRKQKDPYPQMVELLRNSIEWLRGDL